MSLITIDKNVLADFDRASELEWLETNGLGGWASSTVAGAHTRRYHGVLVAATLPPVGRVVLLSRLDETLRLGSAMHELGCNRFPGVVHPRGFEHLVSFERDLFPVFEYEVAGVRLRKTIGAIWGENTTVIVYEVVTAPARFTMELRPLIAARDLHSLAMANGAVGAELGFEGDCLRTRPYGSGPELFIRVPGSAFHQHADWYYTFEYEQERRRGLDFREDLWTPGVFEVSLAEGDRLGVIVSTASPVGREAVSLLDQEQNRRRRLVGDASERDELSRALRLAADQFVVRRGTDLRTVIAGYHWFSDWGRDTMIALPGLCLATGRWEDANKVLQVFAASVSEGMLPNRFPDQGEAPEYNTVDAALWFFIAVLRYHEYTGDETFVHDTLLPVLRDIVAWHDRGTRFGIRVTDDGLLAAGETGVQLTWMDARVGGWVVTPRHGKAVEINALWYNALAVLASFEARWGAADSVAELHRRMARVKRAFGRVFWNEKLGCLFDVVASDGVADPSVRPNQIFALSLPFPLLPPAKARSVLSVLETKLLTAVGLRSLAPDHPDYRGTYGGGPAERDGAYHQGTVWSWLLGPYATAVVRYRGTEGREYARRLLTGPIQRHLSEAGLGTISEIFDGDPPHAPRGCIAQAWSVAEILRAVVEDVEPSEKRNLLAMVRRQLQQAGRGN